MFDIFHKAQSVGAVALLLIAFGLFLFLRFLRKGLAEDRAIAEAKAELDKLAMTLAYVQLAAETNVLSRRYLGQCKQIKRDFRVLIKQRDKYCEQGASQEEWQAFCAACRQRTRTLKVLAGYAQEELYWAKLAKNSYRQAERCLANFQAPTNLPVDLAKAKQRLIISRRYLDLRGYASSLEHSKLVEPLIELCLEESKLKRLVNNLESGVLKGSEQIETARLELKQAAVIGEPNTEFDSLTKKLRWSRLKLEKFVETAQAGNSAT